MISKEEMRAMTTREMEAYMRGYRDGQIDLREILYTNVIPWTTPVVNPTITCDLASGGDTIAKY